MGLTDRIIRELPLWRLGWKHVTVMLFLSVWPGLVLWLSQEAELLAYGPVLVFMPVAWPVAAIVGSSFGNSAVAYAIALGVSIFVLCWLGIVSWRIRRAGRKPSS